MKTKFVRGSLLMGVVLSVALVPSIALANTGPVPEDCVKFEEGDVGSRTSADGSLEVTLFDWLAEDEDGEFHDFRYTASAGHLVSVKAGQFVGRWSDYNVKHALSNVVFCSDGSEPPTPAPVPPPPPTPVPTPPPPPAPSV